MGSTLPRAETSTDPAGLRDLQSEMNSLHDDRHYFGADGRGPEKVKSWALRDGTAVDLEA